MKKIRCRLEYRKMSNQKLIVLCISVANGIYNDTAQFATPAVTQAVFTTTFTSYAEAVARYENAPKIEKTAMLEARKEMIDVLDRLTVYVDEIANGDASLINLSGFVPTKDSINKSNPLAVSESFDVRRTANLGEVEVEVHKISGYDAIWYFVICSSESNLPPNSIVDGVLNCNSLVEGDKICLTKSRIKIFSNLQTGRKYYFYLIGANAVSVSQLSSPKGLQL
ncbi:hypothetical protein OX284_008870 [Flavobacterium sp. SUN046]|uniref:hypothetical protein n=1 Tax=Flavobacterium sp. SUN046 TaxID=3002440 RepID=UPI002DB9F3C1|nr:hypothetical protein [Flavobacterium sp. SUN046]MEC4049537.1 hypothetical protein [Flavobacterium sp. SUN046]